MRWDFFVRHYADDAQQERDPNYRARVRRPDGRRRALSARGTLGGCTAHNAHDPRLPAQRGLEPARGSHRRPVVARRAHARLLRAARALRAPARRARARPARRESEPPRLVRVAADREGRPPDGHLQGQRSAARRSSSRHAPCSSSPELAVTDADRRARLDSELDPERLARRGGRRHRPALYAAHHRGTTSASARASGCSTCARQHPDRLQDPAERARDARAVRRRRAARSASNTSSGERLYGAHPQPSTGAGKTRQVFAAREVILAGGAFNTPQLLMLSGIGPRATLEQHGIPVRVALRRRRAEPSGPLRGGGRQPDELPGLEGRSTGRPSRAATTAVSGVGRPPRRRLHEQRRHPFGDRAIAARRAVAGPVPATRCSAASRATSRATRRCSRRIPTA